jgi:uncharacterized membrane protein YgdD (TMEM256/DUF423 family)
MLQARIFLSLGAVSAGCAVLLGAALMHMPTTGQTLSPASLQNALNMHQFHALGLLLVGLLAARTESPSRWHLASGWLMAAGILLFSVNLYLRGLARIDTFRALVPWGGAAYLLAWLSLLIGNLRGPKN